MWSLVGKIADIVITNHARMRWESRVESKKTGYADICAFLWERLKKGRIEPYYRKEEDVYVVDDDLVMVAEFWKWKARRISPEVLYIR